MIQLSKQQKASYHSRNHAFIAIIEALEELDRLVPCIIIVSSGFSLHKISSFSLYE